MCVHDERERKGANFIAKDTQYRIVVMIPSLRVRSEVLFTVSAISYEFGKPV